MAQHLLMGDLGALLVVLGLTGPLLQPLLAVRWLGWLRTLTHPLIALPLWVINLYVWHIPALYEAAQRKPLHALEHACFIGFGVLMWMPLVGPAAATGMVRDPGQARLPGRRALRRRRARQRLHVVERRVLPRYASGEAVAHLAAHRPGRRRA